MNNKGFEGLEPYEGKLSRTVLRGLGSGNTPRLPDNCTSDRKRYGKMEDVPIEHEYCVVFKKTQAELEVQPDAYSREVEKT